MVKVRGLIIGLIFAALFLTVAGVRFNFKTAEAFYPVNTFAAFTPTGYATITAGVASSSAVLATNALSTPSAQIVVVQNIGSNAAYIKLGANTITTTVAGGYPVLPSQTAILTIRDATHIAAITASGSSALSVTTGY